MATRFVQYTADRLALFCWIESVEVFHVIEEGSKMDAKDTQKWMEKRSDTISSIVSARFELEQLSRAKMKPKDSPDRPRNRK